MGFGTTFTTSFLYTEFFLQNILSKVEQAKKLQAGAVRGYRCMRTCVRERERSLKGKEKSTNITGLLVNSEFKGKNKIEFNRGYRKLPIIVQYNKSIIKTLFGKQPVISHKATNAPLSVSMAGSHI